MFDNIGHKIKVFSIIIFAIEVSLAFLSGLFLLPRYKYTAFIIIIIVVPLSAYINSMFIYGFGELIEKVSSIENSINSIRQNENSAKSGKIIHSGEIKTETKPSPIDDKIKKIESLYSQGSITEEEYNNTLAKLNKLKKLESLFAQGRITEEEYKNEIAKLKKN